MDDRVSTIWDQTNFVRGQNIGRFLRIEANSFSGDLVLISSSNPKGTNPIKIDLPLLLSTSRLINSFPARLKSNSRLFSAAQVQTLRVKRKYDALVGEVSKEKKLQLWTVPPK